MLQWSMNSKHELKIKYWIQKKNIRNVRNIIRSGVFNEMIFFSVDTQIKESKEKTSEKEINDVTLIARTHTYTHYSCLMSVLVILTHLIIVKRLPRYLYYNNHLWAISCINYLFFFKLILLRIFDSNRNSAWTLKMTLLLLSSSI